MPVLAEDRANDMAAPQASELIDRARAMVPTLKARARKCIASRDVSAETVAEMKEAGFFRVLQPRRHGGFEMHPNVFFEIQKHLAEGCMSTAWIYGVLGCHPYQLALFDDRAQQEVWNSDQDMLVSSTYQPVGKVERADGGFYLSGHWGFSSGSIHCGWVLLGSMIPPAKEGEPPEMRTFLLPREDYVIDTEKWHTFGLQGTGSHDIIVDRAFVPEYRTHRGIDGFLGTNPGQMVNTAPLYSMPWAQLFVRSVSTSSMGAARAAVDAAVEIMKSRISTNTGKASMDDQRLQEAIASAKAQMLEMELTLEVTFEEIMGHCERSEPIPMEKRAMFTYQSSTVVRRLADLVDAIVAKLGSKALYMDSAIVQPWLDLNAGRAHVANDPGNRMGDVVNCMMGNPPQYGFL